MHIYASYNTVNSLKKTYLYKCCATEKDAPFVNSILDHGAAPRLLDTDGVSMSALSDVTWTIDHQVKQPSPLKLTTWKENQINTNIQIT